MNVCRGSCFALATTSLSINQHNLPLRRSDLPGVLFRRSSRHTLDTIDMALSLELATTKRPPVVFTSFGLRA